MISEDILIESSLHKNASNSLSYQSHSRFRWYGYKEGFSPDIVKDAILKVGIGKDDYIIDPFNGNGTVTLTASINNMKSLGIEVNPFVSFMSKVKLENFSHKTFSKYIPNVLSATFKNKISPLEKFSTFSEKTGRNKWLFNSEILRAFEAGWQSLENLPKIEKEIFQLALIGAAMDNCNATKDGKCLKYRSNWENKKYNREDFYTSLSKRLEIIESDLKDSFIPQKAKIINGDARSIIKTLPENYKLCITSPPYLNSFDYTDIYRPELFLGKFIKTNIELRQLRYKTIRSHVEIPLPKPLNNAFGEIYNSVHKRIICSEYIWDNQIPIMIQSYFEDMQNVLLNLLLKAKQGGELWLVIANSVYVGIEVPVDLIIAEIGTRSGWKLVRIEVLRNIYRRKTKYSGNIDRVRESLIVFRKS